jgi:hypothetical protein
MYPPIIYSLYHYNLIINFVDMVEHIIIILLGGSIMKKLYAFLLLLISVITLSSCEFIDNNEDYTFYDPLDVNVIIDGNMDQQLIDVSILAIAQYDAIDGIDITYEVLMVLPVIDDFEFEVIFTTYTSEEKNVCSDDDSEVIACNNFWFVDDLIYHSLIEYNLYAFDKELEANPDGYYDYVLSVAIHEFGHTFGLPDLYSDYYKTRSIMYYNDDGGMFTELQPYDIAELKRKYS